MWKKLPHRSADDSKGTGVLDALVAKGVEFVLFVPRSATGEPCSEAMKMDGGRIPISLAEPTPLQQCNNRNGCQCEYQEYGAETMKS